MHQRFGNAPYKFDFQKNLGSADRIIRSFVGLGLVLLTYSGRITRGWGTAAIVFGAILMVEAMIGY